jgi:hypothetical protein
MGPSMVHRIAKFRSRALLPSFDSYRALEARIKGPFQFGIHADALALLVWTSSSCCRIRLRAACSVCVSADAQHVKVATQPRVIMAMDVHCCAGTKRAGDCHGMLSSGI